MNAQAICDNALPMPVSPSLILTPQKTSTLNLNYECHFLKQFLFHILHVTQSRVSMGLTVSSRSVKKLAVRRKKLTNFNPLVIEKINIKNLSFPQCVILCYSGLTAAEKWAQFWPLAFKNSPRSALLSFKKVPVFRKRLF